MSHTWMSLVTHPNGSCHTYKSVMKRTWQSPLKKLHTNNPPNRQNSNSSVQIQIRPQSQLEFVPRDTEGSEFLDVVDFGDVFFFSGNLACQQTLLVTISMRLVSRTQRVTCHELSALFVTLIVTTSVSCTPAPTDIRCHELSEWLSRTQYILSQTSYVSFHKVVTNSMTLLWTDEK